MMNSQGGRAGCPRFAGPENRGVQMLLFFGSAP